MIQRKLKALNYFEWDKVNENDVQHFRKVVVWLEDQKIRFYKIEDRKQLRDITSENWSNVFRKYCEDVKCPITNNAFEQLDWLLGHAIWLEYKQNLKKYQHLRGHQKKEKEVIVPSIKSKNPLDNLDFDSKEFKNGVNSIAKLLRIPQHPDSLITLKACSKFIQRRFNARAIGNPDTVIVRGKPFPIMNTSSGHRMNDYVLDNAAKALTLLYIQDLRNLQTKINEAIVGVQNITANPKTDTKLGKVGK